MASAVECLENQERVKITDDGYVFVHDLLIRSQEVGDFLARAVPEEREKRLVDAAVVGAACLERATTTRDIEFQRAQIESQVRLVEGEVAKIPGRVEEALRKRMGVKNGQLLAPMATIVSTTEKVLKARLDSIHDFLRKEIDPSKAGSTLGRSIKAITELLDGKRDGSIQKVLAQAVADVTDSDGALVGVMQKVLDAKLKPLREEMNRLGKEVRAQQAVDTALQTTTKKGIAFELEVLPTVQCWGRMVGAVVDHVGNDRKPGDILVTFKDCSLLAGELVIVIEARDDTTRRGRKRIADDMTAALKTRGGDYGIYLGKSMSALAREVGDWSEGQCSAGPFVATTADNLLTALRFVLVETRLRALLEEQPEADTAAIQKEIDRIRTAMRRARTIKTKSSGIQRGADAIVSEVDELAREINAALADIEEALQ